MYRYELIFQVVKILLHNLHKLLKDMFAFKHLEHFSFHIDRYLRILGVARKENSYICMRCFSYAVDDASHDSYSDSFTARLASRGWIFLFPFRHFFLHFIADLLRKFLESRRTRSSTSRTGSDERLETTESHRLKQIFTGLNFQWSWFAGFRSQRNPYRITDSLLQQNSKCCSTRDQSFSRSTSFGQTQMQRTVSFFA